VVNSIRLLSKKAAKNRSCFIGFYFYIPFWNTLLKTEKIQNIINLCTETRRFLADFGNPYHIGESVGYDEYELPFVPGI